MNKKLLFHLSLLLAVLSWAPATAQIVFLVEEPAGLAGSYDFTYADTWAANMDTVGTFEIAEEFSKEKMITCLMKHYSV